jgi:hypothetical protein
MTGTNCKNLWSWRLTSPSLALSTSCQSSLQITAPVLSLSVNSPSIYLPHPHTGIYFFILLNFVWILSECTVHVISLIHTQSHTFSV